MYQRKILARIVLLALAAVSMLYLRLLIMGHSKPGFSPADNPAANDPNYLTRLLTFAYLPFCNLWLLLYPWSLSYDWGLESIPLVNSVYRYENFLTLVMYLCMVYAVFAFLKYQWYYFHNTLNNKVENSNKSSTSNGEILQNSNGKLSNNNNGVYHNGDISDNVKTDQQLYIAPGLCCSKYGLNEWNIVILAISVMILPFLPAANIFFYVGFVVAERVLYLPSVGFCLLVANGIKELLNSYQSRQRQIWYCAIFLLLAFAQKTYKRNFVWNDEESLYRYQYIVLSMKSSFIIKMSIRSYILSFLRN